MAKSVARQTARQGAEPNPGEPNAARAGADPSGMGAPNAQDPRIGAAEGMDEARGGGLDRGRGEGKGAGDRVAPPRPAPSAAKFVAQSATAAKSFVPPPFDGKSPLQWYEEAASSPFFIADASQRRAVEILQGLWESLVEFKAKRNRFLGRSWRSPHPPRGVYMWGGVGRGKSFLMDAFYGCLDYRRKRRVHFHAFLEEIHRRLAERKSQPDPMDMVTADIARETRALCFDEFHVDYVADALIMERLMNGLFARGVVVVATSNFAPDELYKEGLNRTSFLPCIDAIKLNMDVVNVDGGADYRLRSLTEVGAYLFPQTSVNLAKMERMWGDAAGAEPQSDDADREDPAPPLNAESAADADSAAEKHVEEHAENQAAEPFADGESGAAATDVCVMGRRIPARRLSAEAVWFDFDALCRGYRSQADYLEIARRFGFVFLSGIPKMTPEDKDAARRFTWLADVFYDARVKLLCLAEDLPERLYVEGDFADEFARTASRLVEMRSEEYLLLPWNPPKERKKKEESEEREQSGESEAKPQD